MNSIPFSPSWWPSVTFLLVMRAKNLGLVFEDSVDALMEELLGDGRIDGGERDVDDVHVSVSVHRPRQRHSSLLTTTVINHITDKIEYRSETRNLKCSRIPKERISWDLLKLCVSILIYVQLL